MGGRSDEIVVGRNCRRMRANIVGRISRESKMSVKKYEEACQKLENKRQDGLAERDRMPFLGYCPFNRALLREMCSSFIWAEDATRV